MNSFEVNILIVEDNLSFAVELEMMLTSLQYKVIGPVDNSEEALERIEQDQPDLIIMDINIKGKLSGIEVGQRIMNMDIPILYVTSLAEENQYKQALQSNLIGYLIKPIDKFTLRSIIDLAIVNAYKTKRNTSSEDNEAKRFISKDSFYFKKRGSYKKVKIEDILFIKSDDNYCQSMTKSEESFTTRMTLGKMEEMLPSDMFLRVHRQYLVQIKEIDIINFQKGILKVRGFEIPISRSRKKELEKVLMRLD